MKMVSSSESKTRLARPLKIIVSVWKDRLVPLVPNNVREVYTRPPRRPLLGAVCSECTPYRGKRNIEGQRDKAIPLPASECSFCALISSLFGHFVGKGQDSYRYHMRMRPTHDIQFCFFEAGNSSWSQEKHVHVQLACPELQKPEHPLGGSRQIHSDPLAPEGIARLKSWMDRCASDHPECALGARPGQPSSSFIPKRLIKIGDSSSSHLQLVSITMPVQYVALSYCWGTTEQSGTTQSNTSAREQQIDVSELPKTLQDGMLVAYALGFQYIWIDSLCIVQDDMDDWACESSMMAQIYSGAYLVIAATRARDCAEGFLQYRNGPLLLDWALPSKPFSKVTARRTTTHECVGLHTIIDGQPLAARAWGMQERELARRTIHFLPDEVLWHCQEKICCECGIPEDPFWKCKSLSSLASFPSPGECDSPNEHALGKAWTQLLTIYTYLGIKVPTDTLPALSGVARYMKHLNPGQYVAGIWEKDIALQLAWFIATDPKYSHLDLRFQGSEKKRPRAGLEGPSFSWISARQTFCFPGGESQYQARCIFVAATHTLATANPYGHVLDCTLTLRGRTMQATKLSKRMIQEREAAEAAGDEPRVFALLDDQACDFPQLLLDSSGNTKGENDISNGPCVVCLELFQSRMHTWQTDIAKYNTLVATALVLQWHAGDTSYTRIGVVSNLDPMWFDEDGVEEVVTIK